MRPSSPTPTRDSCLPGPSPSGPLPQVGAVSMWPEDGQRRGPDKHSPVSDNSAPPPQVAGPHTPQRKLLVGEEEDGGDDAHITSYSTCHFRTHCVPFLILSSQRPLPLSPPAPAGWNAGAACTLQRGAESPGGAHGKVEGPGRHPCLRPWPRAVAAEMPPDPCCGRSAWASFGTPMCVRGSLLTWLLGL